MIVITTIDALPDHCYECPCHDGESGYCQADKELRYSADYRPYWCPLKENHDDQERQRSKMTEKLKPCPFCGGAAKLNAPGYVFCSPYWCKCTRCGAEGPIESSKLEAEKGWNKRVQTEDREVKLE